MTLLYELYECTLKRSWIEACKFLLIYFVASVCSIKIYRSKEDMKILYCINIDIMSKYTAVLSNKWLIKIVNNETWKVISYNLRFNEHSIDSINSILQNYIQNDPVWFLRSLNVNSDEIELDLEYQIQ